MQGNPGAAKLYRNKWAETISEEVFERAKGIIRALTSNALPESPAGVDEHPHCHDHQQRVPKAVVTHQNECALRNNLFHVLHYSTRQNEVTGNTTVCVLSVSGKMWLPSESVNHFAWQQSMCNASSNESPASIYTKIGVIYQQHNCDVFTESWTLKYTCGEMSAPLIFCFP